MTPPEAGSDQQDLRDRIRGVIHASSPTCTDHSYECRSCTARAGMLMTAVVQPVLDAKDTEITRLNEDLDGICEDLNDALNHNDETCEAVKDRDRWRQRAEAAERELATLTGKIVEVE